MADWDVDLSSPTYCAACAVMDTRAEECCSSAWDTAESWWGSYICPSWKCGGCVQSEVIKETPKSSFTLPKPPTVCPFPKFKIELSLDLSDWRSTSATTISSSSKQSSIPNDSPTLCVPHCKSTTTTAAACPQATQYYVGVPTWIHLRSAESSCMPPEVGEDPEVSLWVPDSSSPPPPCPPRLRQGHHRLRRMFPSRLVTKRLSDARTAEDFCNNNFVQLTFKMKGTTPSSSSSPLTSLRCYARTSRRYLPCDRLKTRLKTRLKMLRAYVSNQLYR